MYATINDVRAFVGSQYTDDQITKMLSYTENDITSVVGDISVSEKTEIINLCKVNERSIYFKNIQISEILEVEGKEYTHNYDILPPQNRQVVFEDLRDYIEADNLGTFEVKYMSGYETVPNDLVMAHALVTSEMLQSSGGMAISKYKMGPRTVEYDTSSESAYASKAKSILNKYRLLRI